MDRDPHKGKGPGVSGASPTPTEGGKTSDTIVAGIDCAEIERVAQAKSRSTIAAKLALLGATFHELESGACIVACGGITRHFDCHADVAEFLAQLGGRV